MGLHAPKCTEESCFLFRWLVYISAVWCIYDAKGLIDMKIYTAIRRCMKIIFVMFGFFTLSYARFYLAFNLGFSRTAAQSKSEKEWEWETEEETCVGGMRDFQCTSYIWCNISFANCDCCVSFTLLPSGVRCVVDISLFSLYVYINFLLLHFCLFYISTEHTTRVKL